MKNSKKGHIGIVEKAQEMKSTKVQTLGVMAAVYTLYMR